MPNPNMTTREFYINRTVRAAPPEFMQEDAA